MSKVTQIDRATLAKVIRPALEKKLEELSDELGIKITAGSGSYGGSTGSVKVELATIGEDGEATSRERENFLQFHSAYGLPKEALDKEIDFSGMRLKISGLNIRARKNTVVLDMCDGSNGQRVAPHSVVSAAYEKQYGLRKAG